MGRAVTHGNIPRVENRRKRDRTAAEALMEFRDRLEVACGELETLNQWKDLVSELDDLLETYTHVIPKQDQVAIRKVLEKLDPFDVGLQKACSVLSQKVTATIEDTLRVSAVPRSWIPGLAAGVVVAVAALTFVLVTYANATAAKLTVHNTNCATIPFPSAPLVDWVGFRFPDPIPANGSGTMRIARWAYDIDATQPGRITIRAENIPYLSYSLEAGNLETVALDGIPQLLGLRLLVPKKDEHTLTLACRP